MKHDGYTADEYITAFPEVIQTLLEKVRKTKLENAPDAAGD